MPVSVSVNGPFGKVFGVQEVTLTGGIRRRNVELADTAGDVSFTMTVSESGSFAGAT